MNGDERDRLIGSLVRERAELNTTVSCLQKKLHECQDKFQQAMEIARTPLLFTTATYGGTGERVVMLPGGESLRRLPTASDIAETVDELRRATSRLENLNSQLSRMGC